MHRLALVAAVLMAAAVGLDGPATSEPAPPTKPVASGDQLATGMAVASWSPDTTGFAGGTGSDVAGPSSPSAAAMRTAATRARRCMAESPFRVGTVAAGRLPPGRC